MKHSIHPLESRRTFTPGPFFSRRSVTDRLLSAPFSDLMGTSGTTIRSTIAYVGHSNVQCRSGALTDTGECLAIHMKPFRVNQEGGKTVSVYTRGLRSCFIGKRGAYNLRRTSVLFPLKGRLIMKQSPIALVGSMVLTGSIFAGCATDPHQVSSTTGCRTRDYSCMTQAAFQYRQEAAQYNALAERYKAEADVRAIEFGQNADEVKQQRQLAQQYESKAQEADSLAGQFRRELPHNMMH